jgi:hypothetical protein
MKLFFPLVIASFLVSLGPSAVAFENSEDCERELALLELFPEDIRSLAKAFVNYGALEKWYEEKTRVAIYGRPWGDGNPSGLSETSDTKRVVVGLIDLLLPSGTIRISTPKGQYFFIMKYIEMVRPIKISDEPPTSTFP